MSTFSGLPAHVLLVHFIVVIGPLVAVLEILAGVWVSARSRLVWLILVLAALTTALTPLTTDAGHWLAQKLGPSPAIHAHAERGHWMIYISSALLVVAVLVAALHLRERRQISRAPRVAVAVLAIVVGVTALIQVYRIGESGARAVWGGQTYSAPAGSGS